MNINELITKLLELEKLVPQAEVLIQHEFGLAEPLDVYIHVESGTIRIEN